MTDVGNINNIAHAFLNCGLVCTYPYGEIFPEHWKHSSDARMPFLHVISDSLRFVVIKPRSHIY